ncbi:MAG: serine/threonine protein kinase [Sediminispirochaetaceae bacterium]
MRKLLKTSCAGKVSIQGTKNMKNSIHPGDFDYLTPELIIKAVEGAFGLRLTGNITPYNSYINRVYELHDEDGQVYMAKFYRPGRWSEEAILEEHTFITDCVEMEIPTPAPIAAQDGDTLPIVEAAAPSGYTKEYYFALFPKRGGRNFEAEGEEDWLRLGSLVGRMHMAAQKRSAEQRQYCLPSPVIQKCLQELEDGDAVHPEHRQEFFELAGEIRERTEPFFQGVPLQRVHGDCHRGNILERPGEGLLLIDFDDMMVGPSVQDLWLLLPERAEECPGEFNLVVEGYERFRPFDYSQKRLIEPLRAMRMLYYLAWSARQREDRRFKEEHPYWGSSAFWSKEIEDLREQLQYCE